MVLFRNTKVEGFSEKSAMVWSCCHQYLIIYFLLFMLYEFVISIWIKINVHVYKLSVKLGSSSLESIWFLFTVNWNTCNHIKHVGDFLPVQMIGRKMDWIDVWSLFGDLDLWPDNKWGYFPYYRQIVYQVWLPFHIILSTI